jgi:hypothetical protein
MAPSGYDETTGEYVGPCPDCGTDHWPHPGPETVGGKMECLRRQALALGDDHLADRVGMTQDWMHLAQANALGLPARGLD